MNQRNYGRFPKKRILISDLIAVAAAWFIALLIRYDNWADRFDTLYVSLVLSMCLIQIVIFTVIDMRRASVFEMDPIENAVATLRDRTIVIVLTVMYLYATQRGERSSRLVLGFIYIFSIILDYILRLALRAAYLKKNPKEQADRILHLSPPYQDEEEIVSLLASGEYDGIIVHRSDADADAMKRCIEFASATGVRTYAGLEIPGYPVRSGIAMDVGDYTCVPVCIRQERFNIFGVSYAIARTEEAVLHVIRHIKELSGRYICFSNTHTLVMAKEDPGYRDILNGAAYTFADGNPIASLQMKVGLNGAERVAGPDFMEHMFRDTADGSVSHYFYGASQETLDALEASLRARYPDMDIRGMYSPPFRDLTDEEDADDVRRINASGADIVWVGLGAPKQEKWMAAHIDRIAGVMMGVGAGFDFHAGTVRRAPVWMQKVGLEWLYRLCQDPARLFKRYVVTNFKFYLYRFLDLFG